MRIEIEKQKKEMKAIRDVEVNCLFRGGKFR